MEKFKLPGRQRIIYACNQSTYTVALKGTLLRKAWHEFTVEDMVNYLHSWRIEIPLPETGLDARTSRIILTALFNDLGASVEFTSFVINKLDQLTDTTNT